MGDHRCFAAVAQDTGAAPDIGPLPECDLSDLYPSPDSGALKSDLDSAANEAKAFAARYRTKVAGLDGDGLGAAVAAFERIDEVLSRVMSYAQLLHSKKLEDPEVGRFYQGVNERITDIASDLPFFKRECNLIETTRWKERRVG